MGLSLSLLMSSWKGIIDQGLVILCKAQSFSNGERSLALKSNSFKITDQEPITNRATRSKPNSLKGNKPERVILETNLSFKSLVEDGGFSFSVSSGKNGGLQGVKAAAATTPAVPLPEPTILYSPRPVSELDAAAVKLQKVYKSYRTRRNLADCAVVVEELWWKAIDFANLERSSVSFYNIEKPETAVSRWARARTRAAKVGKGLSKDEKAQKLALQHWLEAIDTRHRYGHNLHLYYDVWFVSESNQPFFYWLDIGDGKELSLEKCPRTTLQKQCIKYLGPKEREAYEVVVQNGRLVYKQSGSIVETQEGTKWIFVLSTTRSLYVGQKKKGLFQHSSFLSGAATTAAGRLVAHDGVIQAIWPYSGHYHPTEANFQEFLSFLKENDVNLTDVKMCAIDDDSQYKAIDEEQKPQSREGSFKSTPLDEVKSSLAVDSVEKRKEAALPPVAEKTDEATAVATKSLNLSKRLSCKWSTGAGPRIGCVRDYPAELQTRALEHVNLSPRVGSGPLVNYGPIPSPRPSPKIRLSPRLTLMGHPSPRTPISAAS
ncbi:IQ domain-containing protein IQM5, partial [Cucurbita argyrosperma subsp. sororia]